MVKETLTQAQGHADFRWREMDIDSDSELRQKYNDEVPVVCIDGRNRMDMRAFLRALEKRSRPKFLGLNGMEIVKSTA